MNTHHLGVRTIFTSTFLPHKQSFLYDAVFLEDSSSDRQITPRELNILLNNAEVITSSDHFTLRQYKFCTNMNHVYVHSGISPKSFIGKVMSLLGSMTFRLGRIDGIQSFGLDEVHDFCRRKACQKLLHQSVRGCGSSCRQMVLVGFHCGESSCAGDKLVGPISFMRVVPVVSVHMTMSLLGVVMPEEIVDKVHSDAE